MRYIVKKLIPFCILLALIILLNFFKREEVLSIAEDQSIKECKHKLKVQEEFYISSTNYLSRNDFSKLLQSVNNLYSDMNYKVSGSKYGIKLNNFRSEFKTIFSILNKKEYMSNTRKREITTVLIKDMNVIEQKYGSQVAYNMLRELSKNVFSEKAQKSHKSDAILSETVKLLHKKELIFTY